MQSNKNIRNSVRNHKARQYWILTVVILSLVVAVTVVTGLIKPGITLTNEGVAPYLIEEEDKLTLEGEDILDVSFVVDKGQEDELNKKDVTFTLEYQVGKGLLNSERKTLVYQLPDEIDIPYNFAQADHTIYDGELVAGTFNISSDGLITIVCYDDYISKKQGQLDTVGATGTLQFRAEINRDEDNNGNVLIDFGTSSEEPDVEIEFKERTLDVFKAGELKSDGLVEWTITVKNPQGHDLGGYTISDNMFERAAEVASTYGTYDADTKQFTFNNGITEKKIEIKYSTKIDADDVYDNNSELLNEVTVTPDNPEDDKTVSDEASVNIKSAFDISKSGKANYDDLGSPSVDWTVNVSNPFGLSLKDMKIQDNAFKNLTADDIKLPEGVEFTVDSTTGTLTITNDVKNTSLDIKYNYNKDNDGNEITTDCNVNNKATIKYRDEEKDFDSSDSNVRYNAYNFGKNASVDSANDLITWTITVQGDGVKNISGLKVKDEMFKDAIDGSIKVKKLWGGDNETVNYTLSDDFIEIGTTDYDGVEITFQTTASDYVDSNGKVKNQAFLYKDDEQIKNTEKEVDYDPKSELKKETSGKKPINGKEDFLEVNYSFTVNQDLKIMPQTITDTLTTTDANALHYISKAQSESISVYGKKKGVGNSLTTLDSTLYTLKFYDSDGNEIDFDKTPNAMAVKFELVLSDEIDDDTDNLYCQIKVDYKATIDASGDDVKAGEKYTFTNVAKSTETDVDDDYAKTDVTHKKIDYSDLPYQKVDSVKKLEKSDINTSDLETVKINGVDNYVLSWYVQLNDNGNYDGLYDIEFTDTLPKGFTLYGKIKAYNVSLEEIAKGNYGYNSYDLNEMSTNNWGDRYSVTTQNGVSKINFLFNNTFNGIKTIYYEATIPCDDLNKMIKENNGKVEIVNTFEDNNEKYAPVKQTENIGQNALNKDSLLSSNCYKNYKIEVNPAAECLSSSDVILLKDLFITQSFNDNGKKYYCYDKGAVNVDLTSLVIYEVDSNGNKKELSPSEYSYTFNNKPEFKNVKYVYDEFTKSDSETFTQNDVQVINGTTVTITLKNFSITNQYNYGMDYFINGEQKWLNLREQQIIADENGNATVTFEVDKDYDAGEFKVKLYDCTADDVEVSFNHYEHEFAAELEVTVPDEKHLFIEYTYYCVPNEYSDEKVGVVNSVETNSQMGAVSSEVGDILVLTGNSGGTITTEKYLTINKVDVGMFTTKLEAEFELWYYDVESKSWLPATKFKSEEDKPYSSVTWGSSSNDTPTTFKTLTTKDGFAVYLVKNRVFKLVETKEPTGYIKNTSPVYFAYGSIPSTLPDNLTSDDINLVLEGGTLNVTNYKKTDISVSKTWDNGNSNHTSDNVYVQLYYSTKNSPNSFPDASFLTAYGSEVVLNAENNWSYTWADLPTGNDKGQAYYYYVKETKYSVNGTTYNVGEGDFSTYYKGNSVNTSDGTPIKILNSLGLQVEKIWIDAENKTMKPMLDKIEFSIYRSKTAPTNLDGLTFPSDAELYTHNGKDTFELSESNDWSMLFTNLPQQDDKGNNYYYYVKEITTSDDFSVLYNGNGAGKTGEIIIRNKSYTVVDTGAELPLTGGHGTTIYYCLGLTIIVFAIFVGFIRFKKIRKGV